MRTDPEPFPAEPFPADVVAAIRDHMNRDHPQDCLLLVRGPGARPAATAAWVTGVDRHGLDLAARVDDRLDRVRIPWSRPLSDRLEVREELVRMVVALRAAPHDHPHGGHG